MGEQTLETLVLKLVADSAQLRADLKGATSAAEKASKSMEGSFAGVAKAFAGVAAAAAATAAAVGTILVGALTAAVAKSYETIDANAKLADRLGLTSDEFAALAHAADLANTSVEAVARASTFLQRQIAAARDPTSEAAAAFAALNINVESFAQLSSSDALGLLGDRLMALDDQATRTALTMQLLGRGAGELDAFLRDGSEGIAEAKRQIEEMGGAISRLDAAKVEEANDAWTSMVIVVKRVVDEVAVQLAPAITELLKAGRNFAVTFIKDMGGVKTMITNAGISVLTFADGWVRTAQTITGVLKNMMNFFGLVWDAIAAAAREAWAAIRYVVDSTIEGIMGVVGRMLQDVGGDIAKINKELGKSIQATGREVSESVAYMSANSKDHLKDMTTSATIAGEAVRTAWTNLFSVDASGAKALQDAIAAMQAAGASGGGAAPEEGGGGKSAPSESPALKKFNEEQAAKLEALRKSLMNEQALEVEAYLEKQEFLNSLEDEQFLVQTDRWAMLEELKLQHEEKMKDIEQKNIDARTRMQQQQWKSQLEGASTFFSNMSSLMNTKSRALFEIGKAAAMATTVVNTAVSAMAAYKHGAEQGGPYLGAAYAAAAIAAGAVQLATISSASPGSGGGHPSSGGMGVPAASGQDPNSPNVGVDNSRVNMQDVVINVNGTPNKEALMELFNELNSLSGDGYRFGNFRVT